MSTRLEMLQVARLAPQLLGESAESVSTFLDSERLPNGAFRGRDGNADLYYTVFGLDALTALEVTQPAGEFLPDAMAEFLRTFGGGDGLDLVHLACLARAWAAVGDAPPEGLIDRLLDLRRDDGGWAMTLEDGQSTSYGTFLAIGALQDLDVPIGRPSEAVDFLGTMALEDGGYAPDATIRVPTTPTTAAAVVALRQLGARAHPRTARWLRRRHHRLGGFVAADEAPIPDLLSTAVALHALSVLDEEMGDLAERLLDFVDTLWTSRGSFFAHWAEEDLDAEYTFYGLLALGHLSVWNS